MRNPALPEEILLEIFRHLKLRDLATCRRVCQCFCKFIKNSPVLQYQSELEVEGFEDVTSSVPLHEKVQHLEIYKRFWNFEETSYLNTFTCSQEIAFGGYALSSTIFAYTPDKKHVELREIPSEVFGIKPRHWTLDPFPYDINALAVDGAHQLLVLVTWPTVDAQDVTIHLLDSETGKPHAHATPPHCIKWRAIDSEDEEWPVQRCNIQIHSDMIAAVFGLWTEEIECEVILAFNWKTGEKLLDARATATPGFVFLDQRYILVAAIVAHVRALVVIDMEHPPPFGYDFSDPSDDKTLPQPLLTFDFPEGLPGFSSHGIGIVDEAIWGSCTHAYPKSAVLSFVRTTDEDVIALHYQPMCPRSCGNNCQFAESHGGTRWLVISKPALMKTIEGPLDEDECSEEDGLRCMSWASWGHCVRKVDTFGYDILRPVHGSRFFVNTHLSTHPLDGGDPNHAVLLDFRTLPLRRDTSLIFRADSPEILEDVELNQPYRLAVLPQVINIDAEAPIAIHVRVAMVGEYFMIIHDAKSTETNNKYHILSV